ncbi:MAG: malto-oligosyltrehalose trehalohydrolase [Elusimicrobiota bacterium]
MAKATIAAGREGASGRPGARYLPDGSAHFRVWAPLRRSVALRLVGPRPRTVPMTRDGEGYWTARVEDAGAGSRYLYRLDDEVERPDPASHFQPEGVHGPSEAVDHGAFKWEDSRWPGVPLERLVLYEMHVGAFSPEGTFEGVIGRLGEIRDLGVTAVELMPVAQASGPRNWGYDGVYPFAVQAAYGGPAGLKRLVDRAHRAGLAVVLDVVYNHLGPEGNYLAEFGPYFTDRYRTPWGPAINYDGPYSDGVRRYFIENALFWLREYHLDGLRIDAIDAMFDFGAVPILHELSREVEAFSRRDGRARLLIAESDLDDPKVVRPRRSGGWGLHAQWSDDFHHALHAVLTGEKTRFYADFGSMRCLEKALRNGFANAGDYSFFRKRRHGTPARGVPPKRFVLCLQNHDQVGNRKLGERLASLVGFEAHKAAAGLLLAAPGLPLLFMGEEYAEKAPFLYFVSHTAPDLVRAVRDGRKKECSFADDRTEPPDPQSEETFSRSKLRWDTRGEGDHAVMLKYYRRLLRLRRELPALASLDRRSLEAGSNERDRTLWMRRRHASGDVLCLANLSPGRAAIVGASEGAGWKKVLDSASSRWRGPGCTVADTLAAGDECRIGPMSFALFREV